MKILLVADYSLDRQKSIELFAETIKAGLTKLGHEVRIIRPQPRFCLFKQSYMGLGKWLGYIDKFILFPQRFCNEIRWADIVHICDNSNSFCTKYLKDIPHVVGCNDLLAIRSALGEFRENPTRWTGRKLQNMILDGLNNTQHAVCISEATRRDLLRVSSLKPENTSVIYMGLNYPYSPMEKTQALACLKSLGLGFENPFLLHVGKNIWYKNRLGVLDIFWHLIRSKGASDFNLIFAGDKLSRQMRNFVKEHNLGKKVYALEMVECEDLRALYSTAEALLYPSLYEGFGWPIIEAQACGCPVFTTNRAPMTEAGGDAAVYIDPSKPQEVARIIAERLKDRGNIQQKGFLNIKRFTTEEMVNKYDSLYKKLCQRQ